MSVGGLFSHRHADKCRWRFLPLPSQEIDIVRDHIVKPLTQVSTWVNVLEARRAREFKSLPKLEKSWRLSQRKRSKMGEEEKVSLVLALTCSAQQSISPRFGVLSLACRCNLSQAVAEESDVFLWELMGRFLDVLEGIPEVGDVNKDQIEFCERFVELLIDLEVRSHACPSPNECSLCVRMLMSGTWLASDRPFALALAPAPSHVVSLCCNHPRPCS